MNSNLGDKNGITAQIADVPNMVMCKTFTISVDLQQSLHKTQGYIMRINS